MVIEVSGLKESIEHGQVKLHSLSKLEVVARLSAKKRESHSLPRALNYCLWKSRLAHSETYSHPYYKILLAETRNRSSALPLSLSLFRAVIFALS